MADDFTQLNLGTGGDVMDESGITYPSAPTLRKRPRIVITGEGIDEIAIVKNTDCDMADHGLVVRPLPPAIPHAGDTVAEFYSTTLVPFNTETTIGTYVVPTGHTFYLVGFVGSGDVNGRFILYVNGSVKLQGRSTAADLNVQISLDVVRPAVAEGLSVSLKVIHNQNGLQPNFDGTILGYIVPNTY
jgi:hypothetical protein